LVSLNRHHREFRIHTSLAAAEVVTVDKTTLMERTGKLSAANLELVLSGIDVVLGR
jgi:hypothetical protein